MSIDLNTDSRESLISQVNILRGENAGLKERSAQLTEKINKQEERLIEITRKFEKEMKSLREQIRRRDKQILDLESGQPPRKQPRTFHAKWRRNSTLQTPVSSDVGSTFIPIISPHGSASSMTPSPSPVNSASTDPISAPTPELQSLLSRCYGQSGEVATQTTDPVNFELFDADVPEPEPETYDFLPQPSSPSIFDENFRWAEFPETSNP